MVIWIIGLSGSGKSFLANKIYKSALEKNKKAIWIDGDEIRKYITYDLGYTSQDRKKNSKMRSLKKKYIRNTIFRLYCKKFIKFV